MLSDISKGHADLADLLFMLAFIVFCVGIALTVMVKPINLTRLAALAGAAMVALAFFVL